MRICLFTPTFLPKVGGTENVTDNLARQFAAAGHEPLVLALGSPAPLDVPYPVRWFRKPLFIRRRPEATAKALARAHRELRFDIVVANYANPTGYGAVRFGERTGLPVVVVSHGGDLYKSSRDRQQPAIWQRTEYTYRHADGLIVISPYIEQLIRQINPDPACMAVIPNGIDLDEYAQPPAPAGRPGDFTDTRPFILCLGNLGPMKGFDDAIDAYARCVDQLGDRTLVIVGDGDLGPSLAAMAAAKRVGDRVIFAGRRVGGEKRWFIRHCDFGLMPSIEEGHPIVGLEFLATGKPIICSTNEAFDGMYDHQVNALRVRAKHPAELAQAMVRMTEMELTAMGAESLRRAPAYGWPATAARYVEFFERVIRMKGAAARSLSLEGRG